MMCLRFVLDYIMIRLSFPAWRQHFFVLFKNHTVFNLKCNLTNKEISSNMGVSCKNCGGTEIDHDQARGDSVCVGCGSVVESLCIVNEVEFQENSAGNASVIGQFVSAEGHHSRAGYKYSLGRDHRQVILDNGKRLINQLGSNLKMTNHCLESAFMFYKMAVSKRFTSGRRTIHVIGACLYLVSRTEKTPHMLLDVCDVVQCDVVTLGRVFLQLARELCIDCPIVDPSLYIHRFAHQLDFGEKENEVSMSALRIMARMKKDWIHFGRRPSALCGAALIIAAKLYNFEVTMKDIVKLVRMSKTTVFKRLMDFSKTATGKLTTDEFKTVDLEEEADPPCYTEGRNRVKFAQEISGQYHFVSTDVLAQVTRTQEKLEELLDKRKNIQFDIEDTKSESKAFDYRKELPRDYSLYSYELDENGEFKTPSKFIIHKEEGGVKKPPENEEPSSSSSEKDENDELNQMKGTVASSTLIIDQSRIQKVKCDEKKQLKEESNQGNQNNNSDEIDLDGINDDEIDMLLLTEEEIKIKTEVWLEENREYLIKMKEKEEEQRRKEEEENKDGIKKKKRKYKRKNNKDRPVCETADEAIKTMLAERKLSSKINYDVLRGLKSEDNIPGYEENEPSIVPKVEMPSADISMVTGRSEVEESMPVVYETGSTLATSKRAVSKRSKSMSGPIFGTAYQSKKFKTETKVNLPSSSVGKEDKTSELDVDEKPLETVVESGPVQHHNEAQNHEYEDEEEEIVTASSLFAKQMDCDEDYGGFDDEDDGSFY
eukprot:TCONS_00073442-protein